RHALSPRTTPTVLRCRADGKKRRFHLSMGLQYTREYIVALERKGPYLVFALELPQSRLTAANDDYENVMRGALHQLLGISDLMKTNADPSVQRLGAKSQRQVFRIMRLNRQMEYLNSEQPCQMVCFSQLMQNVAEEAIPFLKEQFGVELVFRLESCDATVKCNVRLMRCIIFSILADLLQRRNGNIQMRYTEADDQVMLTIRSNTASGQGDTESANVSILKELVRRQQGALLLRTVNDQLLYCLTLPRAQTEGSINEHLQEYLQSDLPDLEIAFADLL
ncbi:MAG: hypothetical protein IJN42_01530, partial [Clostridia bacterium]|nr:hypothetical protein [Clostridia bacterium]